jgi:hypothetical protein
MKRISFAVLFWLLFFSALLSAHPTSWKALSNRIPGLHARNLAHLQQEWQVEEVEPNMLKMTHRETGIVKYVDITNHQIDFDEVSPDVQVIDLINVDTTLYNQKYIRQPEILLVGGALGYPLVIGDFNNNNQIDFAGEYKIPINTEYADAAIAELQEDSTFVLQKIYPDTVFMSLAVTDVNANNLLELNIIDGLLAIPGIGFTNFEQSHPDSFPDTRRFTHQTWEFGGEVGSETFTELDNDIYVEVLYVGTDSTVQCCHQVFVAEYDSSAINFVRRFGMIPSPDWRVSGFSVGDFDNDGYTEFATGSASSFSHVYIWENTGNDSYAQVYLDTIRTANAYMTAATNDIDGNGKPEFFVGGSSFYGGTPASRIYWFEATGNNTYQKVRNIFLLGTDVLGFTELFIHDVNGDGVDDLVFSFSFSIVMLVWNNSAQQFDLFYYDYWENLNQEIHSISMYDMYDQGYPDLFVSVFDIQNPPRIKSFLYRFSSVMGINTRIIHPQGFHLAQNYPNPFNGTTQIGFNLPRRDNISLNIYDVTGKGVMQLIHEQIYAPGEHNIKWNGLTNDGKEVSSGIYLYELTTRDFREVRKMLLIK